MTWASARAERIRVQAEKQVHALAEEIRARYVVPFCDRTGMNFSAGMGSWSFHDQKGRSIGTTYADWGLKPLPKRLRAALEIDAPGFNQDIGSLIPSYFPARDRTKGGTR